MFDGERREQERGGERREQERGERRREEERGESRREERGESRPAGLKSSSQGPEGPGEH